MQTLLLKRISDEYIDVLNLIGGRGYFLIKL